MGVYFNPDGREFQISVSSKIYVDKSMLISFTNELLNTTNRFISVSRPRRFGKSMTADMLSAYYSRGCDSSEIFKKLKVSSLVSFKQHLNQYNVIHVNMANFLSYGKNMQEILNYFSRRILHEIKKEYGDVDCFDWNDIFTVLSEVFYEKKVPFVFIIDEWDCIFREHKNDTESQKIYLDFLRDLLKDKSYVALAYMTGILPIKKYGKHSALNMFTEISMTDASPVAEYTGFTDEEVQNLCAEYHRDYETMKNWYDGYDLNGVFIYNPKSVVESILRKNYGNYWTSTETYEALKEYIQKGFDGLKDKVTAMIAGEHVKVNTAKFQNDMTSLNSADDVLTLLVHLGYLTYHAESGTKIGEVWIPNSEVKQEFINSIEDGGWENLMKAIQNSEQLLKATLNGEADKVAEMIAQVHSENTSILQYNDENSLACVITIAYYAAQRQYILHRELATGDGFADITFIPMKNVDAPAIVVELKHNQKAGTALEQIKKKRYTQKISQYTGEILLVGISYDDKKGHTCLIEKVTK
ncbi:MAG: AAA family ATPase [Oscillospiraceae bacterium]|nr:AAA family ATPase [Oscillospiraceae bacterium]